MTTKFDNGNQEVIQHCRDCGWHMGHAADCNAGYAEIDYFTVDYDGIHYQLAVNGEIGTLTADGELITRLLVHADQIDIPADCGPRYPVYLALQELTRGRYNTD